MTTVDSGVVAVLSIMALTVTVSVASAVAEAVRNARKSS
jgi:hypothetical protein